MATLRNVELEDAAGELVQLSQLSSTHRNEVMKTAKILDAVFSEFKRAVRRDVREDVSIHFHPARDVL